MILFYKAIVILFPVMLGKLFWELTRTYPAPVLEDVYWASDFEKGRNASIKPFKIPILEHVLVDLKAILELELNSNRLLDPLEGIGFEYGFNSKYMVNVLGPYWLNMYNWTQRVKIFNQWPQFITNIGGFEIHFYQIKHKITNSEKETRAVLLLHGFPGSFVEIFKLIPYLTQPSDSKYNFDVILASLPGYGFSPSPAKPGLGSAGMGNLFKRLMERLGYMQYFVVARDAGAVTAADMAALYPDRLLGVHSSLCWETSPQSHFRRFIAHSFPSIFLTTKEQQIYSKLFDGRSGLTKHLLWESGYILFQSTKPDTLGIALSQSPLGLASYILDKFATWTNRLWITREDGGIGKTISIDDLLDNVMIYWLTNSITSGMRFYKESFGIDHRKVNMDRVQVDVPFACQVLGSDFVLGFNTMFVAKAKYRNLQRYTVEPDGGHFAALEKPQVVAKDIIAFFNTL